MKFIGIFPLLVPSLKKAQEQHETEFYRIQSANTGTSLGLFHKEGSMIYQDSWFDPKPVPKQEKWLKSAVSDLYDHLLTALLASEKESINSFSKTGDGKYVLKIGAGYTAYILEGKVLAEAYVASGGNTAIVIHHHIRKESVLYINSRRHGIPELGLKFKESRILETLLYSTWRPDTAWHECDLAAESQRLQMEALGEKIEQDFRRK